MYNETAKKLYEHRNPVEIRGSLLRLRTFPLSLHGESIFTFHATIVMLTQGLKMKEIKCLDI